MLNEMHHNYMNFGLFNHAEGVQSV